MRSDASDVDIHTKPKPMGDGWAAVSTLATTIWMWEPFYLNWTFFIVLSVGIVWMVIGAIKTVVDGIRYNHRFPDSED